MLCLQMMTDRFFVYPTEKAMNDHCSALKGQSTFCYRYVLEYCGRKSFLDLLQEETHQEAARATFSKEQDSYS